MADNNKHFDKVITDTEKAILQFIENMGDADTLMMMAIMEWLLTFDMSDDGMYWKPTQRNFQNMTRIPQVVTQALDNPKTEFAVQEFVKSFSVISTHIDNYYEQYEGTSYTPPDLQQALIDLYTHVVVYEVYDNPIVKEKVKDIVIADVAGGAKVEDTRKSLEKAIVEEKAVSKEAESVAQNATREFTGNYTKEANKIAGYQWYRYANTLIETSRCFCVAMSQREWVHESEFEKVIAGDFPEFKKLECKIYSKYNLPQGMIEGTNPDNFLANVGGYNCAHRMRPVPDSLVPDNVRNLINNT